MQEVPSNFRIYGAAKAATDKMTADMARELRPYGITAISLYPGLVRTEAVMQAAEGGWLDLANSESPEYIGRVVAALVRDARLGQRRVVADETDEGPRLLLPGGRALKTSIRRRNSVRPAELLPFHYM